MPTQIRQVQKEVSGPSEVTKVCSCQKAVRYSELKHICLLFACIFTGGFQCLRAVGKSSPTSGHSQTSCRTSRNDCLGERSMELSKPQQKIKYTNQESCK